MKKTDNPAQWVKFSCSSCQAEFTLFSGHKETQVTIDICSKCHPFFLGKSMLETDLGPAEKLKAKFQRGKEYITKK